MQENYKVYMHIFPNDKKYIGVTKRALKDRFDNYVKITANDTSSIALIRNGSIEANIEYSLDGVNWQELTTTLNYIYRGQTILLRGNNPNGLSTGQQNYLTIRLNGDLSVSGTVMGLLDNGTGETPYTIPNDYCFYYLFENSEGLTSVSDNFLPATTLTQFCYSGMFSGCTNLKKAPELPAKQTVNSCYRLMFNNCISLKNIVLPATTLGDNCYEYMFRGCKSLFMVKISYTGSFTNSFAEWLIEVPSYGFVYYNGSDTTTGTSGIPTGWVKVTF